jgi:hypothetical protein
MAVLAIAKSTRAPRLRASVLCKESWPAALEPVAAAYAERLLTRGEGAATVELIAAFAGQYGFHEASSGIVRRFEILG